MAQSGLQRSDILDRYSPTQFELGDANAELLDEARAINGWWQRWRQAR